MSEDRELLELAAKAAGRVVGEATDEIGRKYVDSLGLWCEGPFDGWFNPLNNDGDALRLAVRLRIDVTTSSDFHLTWACNHARGIQEVVKHEGAPYAATRRAIVRAAAAIGKAMP